MICPACSNDTEMAYCSMSHAFVCMEADCGFELEMDLQDAMDFLIETEPELSYV